MTIYIIESDEDYAFQRSGEDTSLRIDKPCDLKEAKREYREAWDLVGKRVTWKKI